MKVARCGLSGLAIQGVRTAMPNMIPIAQMGTAFLRGLKIQTVNHPVNPQKVAVPRRKAISLKVLFKEVVLGCRLLFLKTYFLQEVLERFEQ